MSRTKQPSKKRPRTRPKRHLNPWDASKDLSVIRGNWMQEPAPLEPGVKFFVLMLEQIGCWTEFSCEGHPGGFYITFYGSEATARIIAECDGFFYVALSGNGNDGYCLRLHANECGHAATDQPWDTKTRDFCLRHTATAWVKRFGPLRSEGPVEGGKGQ